MGIACTYCLLPGESGISFAKGNIFESEDELFAHIESQHHMPVGREGETAAQTKKRFEREQPEAGGPNCRCPACRGTTAEAALIRRMRSEIAKGN